MALVNSLFGVLSLTFFSLSFILAVRWIPLVRALGGLAKQHRVHHLVGLMTVLTTLLHVYLENRWLSISLWSDFLAFQNWGITTGLLALVLLIFVSITSFLNLSFPLWNKFHWLFSLSFCLASYHAFAFAIHRDAVAFISFVGIIAIIGLLMWHYRLWPERSLRITSIEKVGKLTYSLTLDLLKGEENKFCAGMIIYLMFHGKKFSRGWHPFSVASCKKDAKLRLIIKSLGHDTFLLPTLKPGTKVSLHGPYTEFKVPHGKDQIWIAGGVGIAPFLGLAQCLESKEKSQVRLMHFSNKLDKPFYASELDRIQLQYPRFQWKHVEVCDGQLPTVEEIQKLMLDLSDPYFMISGPPKFMRLFHRKLRKIGVLKTHILTEQFLPW